MKQTQLIKGVLEGCVLGIIIQKEVYGYELIDALKKNGFESIVGGTLYPLLVKLEKNGDLQSIVKSSPNGPNRKYYSITAQGVSSLHEFKLQWANLSSNVNQIMKKVDTFE